MKPAGVNYIGAGSVGTQRRKHHLVCLINFVVLLQMPKGYAYMELSDEHTAQVALNMTGVQFMGRTIRVCAFCSFLRLSVRTYSRQVHAYMPTELLLTVTS